MPQWLTFLEGGTIGQNIHNDPRTILFMLEDNPHLAPHIVLLWRDSALVCVAPFYLRPETFSFEFSVWRFLSIPARSLRLFGDSVVVASHFDPQICVRHISAVLRAEFASVSYMQVFGLNYADDFWRNALHDNALSRESGWTMRKMRDELIHRVTLRESFQDYVAGLSASSRQTLRYSTRRLFSDPGVRIEICVTRSDVAQMLHWIDEVYANSWQALTFGAESGNEGRNEGFFEKMAEGGWLRSYVLLRGSTPIAYQVGLLYSGVYYLLECAYRRSEAAASPGSVLTFRAMEDLHERGGVDSWDFGFGDMPYKRTFGNVTCNAATVFFVPRNRWRHILRLQTVLNSSYDAIRSGVVRLGADRLLRKLIKRQK